MEGWAVVKRHVAEEITLLCDRHHRERTSGLLPIEVVREANKNPFNLCTGLSARYALHYSSVTVSAELGSNLFEAALVEGVRTLTAIVIDKEPLLEFRLEDGHVLLSLKIHGPFGNPILTIVDNELCYVVGSAWDFELTGRRLVIREAARRVFLDIEFAVPDRLIVRRAYFMKNGVQIDVEPEAMKVANNQIVWSLAVFSGGIAGVVVGEMPPYLMAAIYIPSLPRFKYQPSGIFALEP
jgi:trigger factor